MATEPARGKHLGILGWGGYLILSLAWSFIIPLGGGIDESRHFRYIQIIAEKGRLPMVAEKEEAISHNPPLYYLLGVPVYLATRPLGREIAWRALRLLSTVLGGLSLGFLFWTLRRIFPEQPRVAQVGVICVGWLPHFLLACAMISNDVLAVLTSTLLLFLTVRAITGQTGYGWAGLAGLTAGLACLSKHNTLVLVPPVAAALALSPWLVPGKNGTPKEEEDPATRTPGAGPNLVAFGLAFVLSGGLWLTHFYGTWGRLDSDPPWPESSWPVHTFTGKLGRAAGGLYRSTWCQVGWLPGPHSPAPPTYSPLYPRPNWETPVLALTIPLVLIGIGGSVVNIFRWMRPAETRPRALATALLLTLAGLMYAALIHNAMYINPGRFEGGRYLLPAVGATLSLLAIGPLALKSPWREASWAGAGTLLLAMNAIAVREMYQYLIPTFAR